MHDRKKILMSITSTHREITHNHGIESKLFLLIQYLYMGVLHTILCSALLFFAPV
jgi:hypothetical protein